MTFMRGEVTGSKMNWVETGGYPTEHTQFRTERRFLESEERKSKQEAE